jgi:Ca2+-dependent lipid-binding protein
LVHLTASGQQPFLSRLFILSQLSVRVIEAFALLQTDLATRSDPYLKMQISGDTSWQKTIVKHSTTTPQWHSDFTFLVTDVSLNSLLITLMDDDVGPDKSVSSLRIPLSRLGVSITNASLYTFRDSTAASIDARERSAL